MSHLDPYAPPKSAVSDAPPADDAVTDRKRLVPLWIKVFGWLFMVMGVVGLAMLVVLPALHQPGQFEMFGLRYDGSVLTPPGLAMLAIILSLAVSAYGLLSGKNWGLDACLVTGYGGVAICLGTMVYAAVAQGAISFRLELLVQVPYLVLLHKMRPFWRAGQHAAAVAA